MYTITFLQLSQNTRLQTRKGSDFSVVAASAY